MFGNSAKQSSVGGVTLVARNTRVVGTLHFTGVLNIEGTIEGDIFAEDGTKSEVAVLEHGVVKGQIKSPRVVINGHVQGDIHASGQLFVAAKAVIEGSVHYRLIEMEKGAEISGNIIHLGESRNTAKPGSSIGARVSEPLGTPAQTVNT